MADVGACLAEIEDRDAPFVFPVVPTELDGPHGFMKHLGASFAMARGDA